VYDKIKVSIPRFVKRFSSTYFKNIVKKKKKAKKVHPKARSKTPHK